MSQEASGLITMLTLIFLAFVSILAAFVWLVFADQKAGFDEGHDKWGPVFDKLKKPGQSIELPIEARGAVGAAMSKRNRALGKRVFAIRIMSASTCRIWRVEA